MHSLRQRIEEAFAEVGPLESQFNNLLQLKNEMAQKIQSLESRLQSLQQGNVELIEKIKELEMHNKILKDEQESFMKVSQLIAYEKENNRLKLELAKAKELVETQIHKNKDKKSDTVQEQNIQIQEKQEQIQDDNDTLEVYSKKINKKNYFISDDDKHIIFEDNDGEIGKEVGILQKGKDGKLKPVFY